MFRKIDCLVLRILVAVVAICSVSSAQTADPADVQSIAALIQQIKDLQQQQRDLQDRIQILEGQGKKPDVADSSAGAPPATVPESPSPGAAPEMHNLQGIQWRGFAELNYKALNQRVGETGTYGFVPGSAANFYTGDFGLFLNSELSERSSVLAEIAFEETDAQNFKVDLRRLLFCYDPNDHFRVGLGRYQTSIGYYNGAFRSASWLQTTADRPLVMEFASNGGPLPTHAIGITVSGGIPSGKLRLNYVAEYGSSDTIRPDINGDGLMNDENNGNQVNLGFFLTPDRVPGLRLGGSIYHDQISDFVGSASGGIIETEGENENVPPLSARWNQTIVNAHVVYVLRGTEFLNEGFLIRHAPTQAGTTFHTPAFYSQLSKRIGSFRPFVRYQYFNASSQNVIYNDVGLRSGPSFGVRYDVSESWALKAQLDHTERRGLPALDGLHLQLSGTF